MLAALAVAVGLLFVLVASQSLRMSSGEGGGRLERLSPVTPAEVSAVKPAFSPDGSQLAYVSDGDEQGVFDLFVTGAAGGAHRRVTRAANAGGDLPTFTADGSALVFARFRTGAAGNRVPDLWRTRLAGGDPVLFIPGASGAGFSSDGQWVAYTRHTSYGPALHCGPVDALELHREIARPGFMPRWSPDGRWVAFSTSNPEGGRGELWIVSPDGASRRQLTRSPAQIYGLAWAGSDRVVFASDETGAFHLSGVGLDGTPPRPLTSGVGDYFSPTIPAGASRIAFAHLRLTSELRLVSLGPGATSRVLSQSDYHEAPRLSPNGRVLASLVSRADVDPRVHVIDLTTGATRRLGNRAVSGFCWVDDDRLALLMVADGEVTDLVIVPIASGDPVLLTRIRGRPPGSRCSGTCGASPTCWMVKPHHAWSCAISTPGAMPSLPKGVVCALPGGVPTAATSPGVPRPRAPAAT